MAIRARMISFRTMMKGFDPVAAQMNGARAVLARDAGRAGADRSGQEQREKR